MKLFSLKNILLVMFIGACFIMPYRASADCLSYDLSVKRTDAELRKLLSECEAGSAATQKQLEAQRAKSSSIASDVALLDSLIKKAGQQIEVKNQLIKQLGGQINQKEKTIQTLSSKLDREHQSLAQILRKKNEIDDMTLAEMMLSNQRISDFMIDIDNFQSINSDLEDSMNNVKNVRQQTYTEKTDLENKKTEQANLKNQIEAEKKKTEIQQADKKVLLNESKNQEASYQKQLAERQAKASAIRAKLFELTGISSGGIPFGDAYKYAKEASQATGVQAAFILAILKQESGIGKNVGGCVVTDTSTGSGYRISTGEKIAAIMKPTRDVEPFKRILGRLGIGSTANTPVSCPIKTASGAYSGYGGAMGPSQFIPSTWELFAKRIETALGAKVANPWNPEHAIMATAMYVRDLGAQNPAAQKDAACKYYSGRSCSDPSVSNAFYGNSVMAIKAQIQSDIDVLESAN